DRVREGLFGIVVLHPAFLRRRADILFLICGLLVLGLLRLGRWRTAGARITLSVPPRGVLVVRKRNLCPIDPISLLRQCLCRCVEVSAMAQHSVGGEFGISPL